MNECEKQAPWKVVISTYLQGEGNWKRGRGGGGVGVGVDVGKSSYCRLGIIIVIYVTVPYLFRSPHLGRNGDKVSLVT
ncbi:uncharacterized protein N7496_011989 [Penicillium cataractarum]|uniref:Transmembrane protein n=1 Tax=Penicillium cataractarum TaxID=2100454 RepID=A0A9W9UYJ6_9EURO|nr:uncharacterized protein N7496_011989 [Penicillium cataractarum]KAJ5359576.1 hypothetical protein N7496_011989 [Penicillium cataractarum]